MLTVCSLPVQATNEHLPIKLKRTRNRLVNFIFSEIYRAWIRISVIRGLQRLCEKKDIVGGLIV